MNELNSPMDGLLLQESDISPEYRDMLNRSRQEWTLQQFLKVEESVRPSVAADLRMSIDTAKTEHARQIFLNQHINIQERYFRRSAMSKRNMRKAMLEDD